MPQMSQGGSTIGRRYGASQLKQGPFTGRVTGPKKGATAEDRGKGRGQETVIKPSKKDVRA